MANLVQVEHPQYRREGYTNSTSLLHLATITEVTDKDNLGNLDGLNEDLEPGHIERLVEVLQVRAKDIRDTKKKADSVKQTMAKPNRPDDIRPDENRPVQPSLPVKWLFPQKLLVVNPFHRLPCPHYHLRHLNLNIRHQ